MSQKAEREQPEEAPAPTIDAGRLLLIVEPQPPRLHQYQSMLEQAGYRVIVAPYSTAAEVSSKAAPAVIILQWDALLSGNGVVRELRGQPVTRGTPVVALMRSDDAHTREQIVRAGATAILIEPVKPPMLLRQLRRLMARPLVGSPAGTRDQALAGMTGSLEVTRA